MAIPKKTLEDLEFESVVDNIVSKCVSSHGKKEAKSLKPLLDFDQIDFSLNLVSEYLSSLDNDNNFPNHFFESISNEIKIIQIDNSQLEIESFRKIKLVVELTLLHIKFLKKFTIFIRPVLQTILLPIFLGYQQNPCPVLLQPLQTCVAIHRRILNHAAPETSWRL